MRKLYVVYTSRVQKTALARCKRVKISTVIIPVVLQLRIQAQSVLMI